MPPRKRLLLILACLPLVGLTVLAVTCRRRPAAEPTTPEGLRETLAARGLDYEIHTVPRGGSLEAGVYFRRPGDARPWAGLASQESASRPERWRGYFRATPLPRGADPAEAPGRMRLGPLLLAGDPDELRRVAAALR